MLLPWCTNAEQHLSSSCSFYLQLQVSASQSSLCAELYPLFLPQLPFEVLALTSAFLHSEVVIRIFETMAAVVNGSLDNNREIREINCLESQCHSMHAAHTQVNCTKYVLLYPGLELAKLLSCTCTVPFSLAATATSAKKALS